MENIFFIDDKKFKNNAISLVIPFDLDDKVTDYNLIASILKRGTKNYASTKEIWSRLQELYGAIFDIVISKKGEKLFMNFYISFLDDKFCFDGEDLWKEAIDFLKEIIDNNQIKQGSFNEEYFNQEKENLRILINSKMDDKGNYSIDRVEEICTRGEAYSTYKYGDIDRLKEIDIKALTELWNSIKKSYPMYGFICGNFEKDKVIKYVSNISMINNKIKEEIIKPFTYKNSNIESIVEKMNVNQGKLSLCYRTHSNIFEGDYFALSVMNSILGGGPHSKLFNEVREKNSLAYYSYSFIEKFKGLLVISSGVDFQNFEKAKAIILKQLEEIQKGNVSEEELENSKNKLITSLKTLQDSQYTILDYISALRINGIDYSLDYIISETEQVTLDRVINESKKLDLGSIHIIDKI